MSAPLPTLGLLWGSLPLCSIFLPWPRVRLPTAWMAWSKVSLVVSRLVPSPVQEVKRAPLPILGLLRGSLALISIFLPWPKVRSFTALIAWSNVSLVVSRLVPVQYRNQLMYPNFPSLPQTCVTPVPPEEGGWGSPAGVQDVTSSCISPSPPYSCQYKHWCDIPSLAWTRGEMHCKDRSRDHS